MLVWNYPGCMEFLGLYGISRAVWDIQTSSWPIKFLETRSVRVGHVIKSFIKNFVKSQPLFDVRF